VARVGFASAILGGSVGVIAGVVALSDKNAASNQCVPTAYSGGNYECDQIHGAGALDSARTWATICNVSLGAGAVGLVLGIVAQLNGNHDRRKPQDPSAARIQPWVTPGMVGLHAAF
jgi:hypothetical protein